ncbi:matrixin family metalloprotease [Patulibacter defluvii]|uniref:matrixin family metalloprotease n=1 Tax=Patulibacter defluvii TaxID=3095358 RepID=UPI002A765693|nr:matrixin family metalloprotease [Patulibacter sp. DM4]
MRGHRLLVTLAAIAATSAGLTAPASGHVLYDGGNLSHNRHGRDINFINGTSTTFWDEVRWAQLAWHSKMDGSLRFPTTGHDASIVHAVDTSYGATGWGGYAYNAGYHAGHGHLQLNTSYAYSSNQRRVLACHELGHFIGMAHSSNASDCMVTPVDVGASASIATSHRDQLRAAWNGSGH